MLGLSGCAQPARSPLMEKQYKVQVPWVVAGGRVPLVSQPRVGRGNGSSLVGSFGHWAGSWGTEKI